MIALSQDLVNCKACLLHDRAAVLEVVRNLLGCFLQRTIKAISLVVCRALTIVCAIPLSGRIEKLTSALHNLKIALRDWRICVGRTAEFRILAAERKCS